MFLSVKSQINQLQNDSLGKSNEKSLESKLANVAQKVKNVSLCNSLLMDLGQQKQQHSAVHTGGVCRGRFSGCGCWH